jgi:cell wall-associated NlpC family hydrolase
MGLTVEQRERVVAAARSWLGTPFHHGTRQKGVGVDCGNLLVAVYLEAGVLREAPAFEPPPPGWHLHHADERYLRLIARYCQPVRPPWEAGDVLVFRGRHWPSAGHAGLFIGDGLLIHAVQGSGVLAWPLASSLLQATLDSGWRWAGEPTLEGGEGSVGHDALSHR